MDGSNFVLLYLKLLYLFHGIWQVVQCSQVYLQSYVGSMMYMAPEFFPASMDNSQIKYKKTVDIYSLAMVIYQIYTGAIRHDFYPGVEDIYVLIGYKSRGEKPKMDQLTNVVPASVAPLVDRAVDKDPKQRPSLVEFAIAVAMS